MNNRSRTGIITGILILNVAGTVIHHTSEHPAALAAVNRRNTGRVLAGSSAVGTDEKRSNPTKTPVAHPDGAQAADGFFAVKKPAQSSPEVTKAGQRDSAQPGGPHKVTIDPMASWKETPPWPEGPHLLVDVETSGKRYVNLRPNDKGLMPRLNVNSNENLSISLSLPDSDPSSCRTVVDSRMKR